MGIGEEMPGGADAYPAYKTKEVGRVRRSRHPA
ncbi:Uncharacterised protein [Enterobacter cloacae]|nr:Uncharacterised protein [Enterobacter cloacae]